MVANLNAGVAAVHNEGPTPPSAMPPTEEPPASPPTGAGIGDAVLSGFVGRFYSLVEGVRTALDDLAYDLPQIVVVGQESSGKSSVLESLAMMPLFPRDEALCTRLPILFKMRHVAPSDAAEEGDDLMPSATTAEARQIRMRLVYADGREPLESSTQYTPSEASQRMAEWMKDIVKRENKDKIVKGVVDHVLEIEVRSPLVPNLNLVDLPGIVAGRLLDEPDDMMQQTRALVEKYLRMPHTLVLAVVPAFERVRNSQAFQLVQQYELADSTIGVLTMVDRSLDVSNPRGPLAEVKDRLDGSSRDIVYLKHGYVAVKNRDTRQSPECSLEKFKAVENKWLGENLPGCIDGNLASSTVLAHKLEKMLAEHVTTMWVPQTLDKIKSELENTASKLVKLGPGGQDLVDGFLGDDKASGRRSRFCDLIKTMLPKVLEEVDDDMLRLATSIEVEFIKSRDEHYFFLAPFGSSAGSRRSSSTSLMMPALLILDSHWSYIRSHLSTIIKNIALRIMWLIRRNFADGDATASPQRLDRFTKLHLFFARSLWEKVNELLMDEEVLVEKLEQSFFSFGPERGASFDLQGSSKTTDDMNAGIESFAEDVEMYLELQGFQNTAIDEFYRPSKATWSTPCLERQSARAIIRAKVPEVAVHQHQNYKQSPAAKYDGFGYPTRATTNEQAIAVGEFEARLFFALSTNVIAPLFCAVSDVGSLERKLHAYLKQHPTVAASPMHVFHDNTQEEREQLEKLAGQLETVQSKLKAMQDLE